MSNQLVVNGQLINYYKFGAHDLPALIFLHGWRSEGKVWTEIVQKLTNKQQAVFCLDLPGFGGSALPKNAFSVSDYAETVAGFIKKMELKKVILIGHSFGGRIAIKLAASQPPYLKKLILVDSAGIRESAGLNQKKALAKLLKPLFKPKFMAGVRRSIYKVMGAEDFLARPELKETFLKVVNEDLTLDLDKISLPTLIVWGQDDAETPLSQAKVLKEKILNSKLVTIDNAGHFSFIDKPERFASELNRFIT